MAKPRLEDISVHSYPGKISDSEEIRVMVRKLDRVAIENTADTHRRLMVNETHVWPRDLHDPLVPKDSDFLKNIKPGDSFLQVIYAGKTVMLYGPLNEENMYVEIEEIKKSWRKRD